MVEDKPQLLYVKGLYFNEMYNIRRELENKKPMYLTLHYDGDFRLQGKYSLRTVKFLSQLFGGREERTKLLEESENEVCRVFYGIKGPAFLHQNDSTRTWGGGRYSHAFDYFLIGFFDNFEEFGFRWKSEESGTPKLEDVKKWIKSRGEFYKCLEELDHAREKGDKTEENQLVAKLPQLEERANMIEFPEQLDRSFIQCALFDGFSIAGPGFKIPSEDNISYPIPQRDFRGLQPNGSYDRSTRSFMTSGFARGNAQIWGGDEAMEQIVTNHDPIFVELTKRFIDHKVTSEFAPHSFRS